MVKTNSTQDKREQQESVAITGDMLLIDVIAICPAAEGILKTWGLHCIGCGGSALETLSQGARSHGFGDDEVEAILEDVNTAFAEAPKLPEEVVITEEAAKGFMEVARGEGRDGQALRIVTDGQGGFCLEFETETESDDPIFANENVPEITVRVSPLILRRVGGAKIDKKNGRFALELAGEDKTSGCGCNGGSCDCGDGGGCACKGNK